MFYQLTSYICQIIYVFGCSDPGYYFRFVGLLVQYIIIVVDLFHNGIRMCFIQFKNQHLKIIHVDASIINSTNWRIRQCCKHTGLRQRSWTRCSGRRSLLFSSSLVADTNPIGYFFLNIKKLYRIFSEFCSIVSAKILLHLYFTIITISTFV